MTIATEFQPGPILLMGAPGVGKGTQAKLLMARWAIPQISTGDLLRANIAAGSGAGLQAKSLMDVGQLVPDALVNRMVEARLGEPDTGPGYLLDGYPRTVVQAESLDRFLKASSVAPRGDLGTARARGIIAVSLHVPYNQLLRRITGRRLCPQCGRIYNVYLQPPAREGFCDVDGISLQRRDDDSEAVFGGRMRAYEDQTAPVLGHYRSLNQLIEVDGEGEPETIAGRVEAAIIAEREKIKSWQSC